MGGTSQGARKAALTKGLQSGILPEEKDYGQNPYSKVHIPFSEKYATASGTSQGAKKGWQTRKRGGGKDEEDKVTKWLMKNDPWLQNKKKKKLTGVKKQASSWWDKMDTDSVRHLMSEVFNYTDFVKAGGGVWGYNTITQMDYHEMPSDVRKTITDMYKYRTKRVNKFDKLDVETKRAILDSNTGGMINLKKLDRIIAKDKNELPVEEYTLKDWLDMFEGSDKEEFKTRIVNIVDEGKDFYNPRENTENNEEEVPRKIPARTITKSGNPQDNIPRITKSGTSYEGSLMKELRNDIREFYTKTQSYEKVLSELKVKSDESEDPNQKQEYITSMEKLKLKHGIAERRLKQAVREYRKLRQRGEQESQRSKWLLENVAKMSLVESLIAKENKVKGWWNRLSKHDKIYHLNNLKGAGGGWDKDEYVKRGKHLNYHDFSPALKQYIDIYYDELVRGNMLNPPRMQHWKKIYGNNAREEYPTEDIDWEIDRAEQQIRMSKGHHLLNPMFKEKLKTLKKLKRQGYTKVKVSGNDYVGVENEKLDVIYNDKKKAQASGTSQGAIKAWKKRKRGGGKDEDEDLQKQHDKLGDKIDSLYSKNYYDKLQEVDRKIEQLRHDKDWKTIPKSKWSDKKLALYDKLKQKYAELSRKDKENDKEIDKLQKMQDKIQSRIDAKPDSDLNISNRQHQAEWEDIMSRHKFDKYVEDYMGGFKTVSVKGGTNSSASLKPTKITMPKEKIRFGDHTGTMFFKIQKGNELLEPHFITFNKLSKASQNDKTYQKIRSELTLKAKDLNQNMYGGVMDLTDYIAGNFDVFYKHGVTGGIDDMSQYNQSSEDKALAEDWLNEVVDILGVDLDHIDPSDFVETHAPDLLENYGKDDYDDDDDYDD